MSDFLRSAMDKALQSENGHLDLFLCFLLGLSLESNHALLRGLMLQTGSSSHSKQETVKYIKEKIRENPFPEKSINLFHCLNELNDHSLVQEVQTYLNRGGDSRLRGTRLSPAQWSALVFVLLNSEQELDVFDLRKYDPSEECLLRLLPVVKASRKAEPAERHSLSSVSWVFPGASDRWGMPGTPLQGDVPEASETDARATSTAPFRCGGASALFRAPPG
ncbi:hypothetical protein QTP86_000833 [Hemibagrus guttatus]|nr:hypothetical protein QTP86_000833 [Hemibagrus guttatus]